MPLSFLAPGADLLEHGSSAPVGWAFDEAARKFRLEAAETMAPGVRVRRDYGALTSAAQAARFGFVSAGNPFEAVPLRIRSRRRPASAAASACLASLRLEGSQQLTARGIGPDFLDAARVASMFAQGQTRGSLAVLAALNGVTLPGLPRAPPSPDGAAQASDIAALCSAISASPAGNSSRKLVLPAHQEIEMLNDLRVAIATTAGGVEAELSDLQSRGEAPRTAAKGVAVAGPHADSRRGRVRPRRRVFERREHAPPSPNEGGPQRDVPLRSCGALTQAVRVELGLLRLAQSQVVARLAQAGRALDGSAPRLESGAEVRPPKGAAGGPMPRRAAAAEEQLAAVDADGTVTSIPPGGEPASDHRIHVDLDMEDAAAGDGNAWGV